MTSFFNAALSLAGALPRFAAGERRLVPITLEKHTAEDWPTEGDTPVRLTYRWLQSGAVVVADGLRTPVPDLAPGQPVIVHATVQAPAHPGTYVLRVTLVRERVAWFETRGLIPVEVPVTVHPSFYTADLEVPTPPTRCRAGERSRVLVRLTKRTPLPWPSGGDQPVRLTYHWLDRDGRPVAFDGLRTPVPPEAPQGRALAIGVLVEAPPDPGRYILQMTLVRERVAWFEEHGFVPAQFAVDVVANEDSAWPVADSRLPSPLEERLLVARGQPRPFRDWGEYWRWSMVHRELHQPWDEPELRVIGYMEGTARRLAALYAPRAQSHLVSVIMPVFNRAGVVGNAIASVQAQRYATWELLVVDDGSDDGTVDVVRANGDARIRLIRHQENRGVSAARNTGLAEARGAFVAYLDSDNTWHPDFLLVMVHALADATWASVGYSAQRVIRRLGGHAHESIRFGPFHRALLENENYLDINAVVHRRTLLEDIGAFNEGMRAWEDWEFLLRATRAVAPLAVPAALSCYYYDEGGDHTVDRQPPHREGIDAVLRERAFTLPLSGDSDVPSPARRYTFFVTGPVRQPARRRFVSVIIPSYEAADYLSSCLDALLAFTETGTFEVIVVDNASSAPVRQCLGRYRQQPAVRVVVNEENRGFSAAVNQGLALTRADADVVLLNNDALVTPGWLQALQEAATSAPGVGLVAPRQVLLPGTDTIWDHVPGCNPDREIDVTVSAHHRNVVDPLADPALGLVELSFAPFFCVYITRECLERCGGLDAELGPHYVSDRLYCDMARHGAGLRILYTPHAKVYHFLQRATAELESRSPEQYRRLFAPAAGAVSTMPTPIAGPSAGSERSTGLRGAAVVPGASFQPVADVRPLDPVEAATVRDFTRLYCDLWKLGAPDGRGTISVGWLGYLAQKCPLDLWAYQEILVETRPDLIVECGTRLGGSALFLASVCQLLGHGRVLSVDVIAEPERPAHPRISYVQGSSVGPDIVEHVRAEARPAGRVMVILDSDHTRDHVLAELHAYADLVTPGCYLVVEDTVVNGHPFWPAFGPGPMEAVDAFLAGRADYETDPARERFLLTLNPRGYLRRRPSPRLEAGVTLEPDRREDLAALKRTLIDLDGIAPDDGTRFMGGEAPRDIEERRRLRLEGRDWPARALSMAGLTRLDQLQAAIETVVAENVPGDIVETGVWRGGACILARRTLTALGVTDRRVWLADSFQGLPPPDPARYPADAGDRHHEYDYLRVSLDTVRANLEAFGALDEQVRFLPGWFADTLPGSPIGAIAVLRLDGDMYESTHVALDSLYGRLAPGGFVIVDDYGAVTACRRAVDDFRWMYGITAPLIEIDWTGRYWRVPVRFNAGERARLSGRPASADASGLDLWPGHARPDSDARCEEARRALEAGDAARARALLHRLLDDEPNSLPAHNLLAHLALPGPDYRDVLAAVHRRLRPRTYVELGVFKGESLAIADAATRVTGVDPRPLLEAPPPARARLFQVTSAEFFAGGHAERWLAGEGFDLAFIDASHQFADALLDLMCLERFAHRGSVVLLHDTLPVHPRVADPARSTTFYTGDVWKVAAVLRDCRPDLEVRTVPCPPSGLTVIRGLDPDSRALWDGFDEIVGRFAALDEAWLAARHDEVLGIHRGSIDELFERGGSAPG